MQNCTLRVILPVVKKCSQMILIRVQSKAKRKRIKTNKPVRLKLNSKTQVYQGELSSKINPSPINLNLRAFKTRGTTRRALLIRRILNHANRVGVIAKGATVTERNPCKKSSNRDF